MTKTNFLVFALVVMFLANIALVLFLFMSPKPGHGPGTNPREIIIERLHFTENQVAAYDVLIAAHEQKTKHSDEELNRLKAELYHELIGEVDAAKVDSIKTAIAQTQSDIETAHFNHFLDIKKLCQGEQVTDFEKLATELARIFNPKPPRRPR